MSMASSEFGVVRSIRAALPAFGLALVLLGSPLQASAETLGNEAGYGIGSAFCSMIYAPLKVVYAGGGSVVAGLAYLLSAGDAQVAGPILTAAVRGDYLVTPQHLRGERQLEFIGRDPKDRALRQETGEDLSSPDMTDDDW